MVNIIGVEGKGWLWAVFMLKKEKKNKASLRMKNKVFAYILHIPC